MHQAALKREIWLLASVAENDAFLQQKGHTFCGWNRSFAACSKEAMRKQEKWCIFACTELLWKEHFDCWQVLQKKFLQCKVVQLLWLKNSSFAVELAMDDAHQLSDTEVTTRATTTTAATPATATAFSTTLVAQSGFKRWDTVDQAIVIVVLVVALQRCDAVLQSSNHFLALVQCVCVANPVSRSSCKGLVLCSSEDAAGLLRFKGVLFANWATCSAFTQLIKSEDKTRSLHVAWHEHWCNRHPLCERAAQCPGPSGNKAPVWSGGTSGIIETALCGSSKQCC